MLRPNSGAQALTQPWLRVENFGSSIMVTARDETGLGAAKAAAQELASELVAGLLNLGAESSSAPG